VSLERAIKLVFYQRTLQCFGRMGQRQLWQWWLE